MNMFIKLEVYYINVEVSRNYLLEYYSRYCFLVIYIGNYVAYKLW